MEVNQSSYLRGRLTGWIMVIILVVIFGTGILPVLAQDSIEIILKFVQTDSFPTIRFWFEVYDTSGNFIENIHPSDVQLAENGETRPLLGMERIELGIQTIIALNAAPVWGGRLDESTYFENIQTTLLAWSLSPAFEGLDDFSLVTNTGLQAIRLPDRREWTEILSEYQPNLAQEIQSLASLNLAMDLALDTNPSREMKRSILYITPPPLPAHLAALPNLTGRAVQQSVQVNVWLLGPAGQGDSEGITMLQAMAEETGGFFFQAAAGEELPDLNSYLRPLRYSYRGEYRSGITRSGMQSLSVQVRSQGIEWESPGFLFSQEVAAPNPIFLSPPTQVVRSWIRDENSGEWILEPDAAMIPILVEFQDGYPRELISTTLYVNGELAAENIGEPYDLLRWDLEDIEQTGTYQLQLAVEDELGLNQRSISIPVDVIVESRELSYLEKVTAQGITPFVIVISFVVAVVSAVLFMTRGNPFEKNTSLAGRKATQYRAAQPDQEAQSRPGRERTSQRKNWAVQTDLQDSSARLVLLDESTHESTERFIPLTRQEITLGNDPKLATHVLDSASVNGLHARITRVDEDQYLLADSSSIAGTWINYSPVSTRGSLLRHGDLIHIGSILFRFKLAKSPPVARIKVVSYNMEGDAKK